MGLARGRTSAIAAVALLLVLLSACSGSKEVGQQPSSGQPAQVVPIKAKIGISGRSINYVYFWIAYNKGFFKQEGLDLSTVEFDGGPPTTQAMIAGDIPIGVSSSSEVVACVVAGCDLRLVATMIPYSPYQLIGRPGITGAADLKGKKVAISKLASESHYAAKNLVTAMGMEPEKGVAYVAIGDQTKRLQALIAGSVDAAVVSPPGSYSLQSQGYTILSDLIDAKKSTAHENIISTERTMKENPELLRRFMRGLARGIHSFKTDAEGSQKIIAEYLALDPVKEKEIIVKTWTEYAEKNAPQAPYPDVAGIKEQLKSVSESLKDPKVLNDDPNRFVNATYVKELEDSGFIKQLYGK